MPLSNARETISSYTHLIFLRLIAIDDYFFEKLKN